MKFTTIPFGENIPVDRTSEVFLVKDNWDDNFKFSTLFNVYYSDEKNTRKKIGSVKIGQFGMGTEKRSPDLPETFVKLSEDFFSLGSDEEYYSNLNEIGEFYRNEVLISLRDVARDLDLFEKILKEPVTELSLLRFVSVSSVKGQFHRLTQGGARLTDFLFRFQCPPQINDDVPPVELDFQVLPESTPPTNIHVLIGTNGVGKTFLLDSFAKMLIDDKRDQGSGAKIIDTGEEKSNNLFAGLITISFSAFDNIEPLSRDERDLSSIRYHYIGLKQLGDDGNFHPMSPDDLAGQFADSLAKIKGQKIDKRWKRAIRLLETDPKFRAEDITALADNNANIQREGIALFSQLSSGHKIILLTITRLVETVEEKTLILMDEPEAHLHPPLLSAFIRALSDLLIHRNGIAIIATHSPVVLQEVPRSCVWILNRYNSILKAERPERETFGENVGALTRDVFGLEVTASGFHKMLLEIIDQKNSYEEVLQTFNGEIGDEAKAIVRSLMIKRNQASDT